MRRLSWVLVLLFLAGCAVTPPALPTASPPPSVTTTAAPVPSPALPSQPVEPPTPAPAAQVNAADVLGFTPIAQPGDGILYARADGSVILHDLITGDEQALLGPENYVLDPAAGEGYFLLPISYPVTASPNGQWLIIPTQWQGTWLVAANGGQRRKIADHPLAATWAPDSHRIAYTHNWGQQHPEDPNAIFIRNVVRDHQEKRLAELPGKVFSPVWSPDCPEAPSVPGRDCGRHLAASAYTDNPTPTTTIWLIDAATGKRRELCRYSPPGRETAPSDYLWSMTGVALWAMPGERVCPLDGGPPRPFSQERMSRWDALSPNRHLLASVDPNSHAAITVRRTDSGAGVVYAGKWNNIHAPVTWLNDSENLVVVMGQEQGHDIFILQLFDGELTPIAHDVTFLGVMSQLQQRNVFRADSSENAVMLPPAGPEETWQPYHLPDMKMTLSAPAEWRVQQIERGRYVIANFTMTHQAGLFSLPPGALEIVISRTYGDGLDHTPETWLRQLRQSLTPWHDVAQASLAGRPALRITDKVAPVREIWRTFNENYEIVIERAPLNSADDELFQQILNSIHWDVN